MGSDRCTPPEGEAYRGIHGNAVSPGTGEAERGFAAVANGGTVTMPIGETSRGSPFGMLADRCGPQQMVNCSRPQ